jgi:hypothetical protein
VPLLIRAPWKRRSIGATVDLFAELIDLYPTVAELVGSPKPKDALDGVSLAPVLDNPSLATLPDPATENKTLAFSQFPYTTDNGCMFFRDIKCSNSSRAADPSLAATQWMGFRVRTVEWSYCAWLPWDPQRHIAQWPALNESVDLAELYDHRGDSGVDFDGIDIVNVAYEAENADVVKLMYRRAFEAFNVPPPGGECAAAGGIRSSDGVACCVAKCGKCGGQGCAKRPGGAADCCSAKVEANGRDCRTAPAPCSVNPKLFASTLA